MANILKIKRSDNSNGSAPTALARGELAYQEVSKTLYIGAGEETSGEAANEPVVAGPLNVMPAPTGNVSMTNSGTGTAYRITGLAAPTSANDAARKADVDAAVQGLDVRESVRLAATGDVASPGTGVSAAHTVDGVTVVAGDRILLKAQNPASENGIYVVAYDASNSGAEWTMDRAADLNDNADCSANMFFFVEEGSSLADTGWVCTTNETVTLANMVFAQFSGTGSYTAEDGLDINGTAFGIADGGVTLARMADMATDSILGRDSAGTGAPEVLNAATARSVIGVDAAGTDNSTDVTLATVAGNYLSISGQVITAGEVPVSLGGTGLSTITANGVMYGAATGDVGVTAQGGDKAILYSNSGTPAWTTTPDGLTIDCGTF